MFDQTVQGAQNPTYMSVLLSPAGSGQIPGWCSDGKKGLGDKRSTQMSREKSDRSADAVIT